jgi:hypothetical protein
MKAVILATSVYAASAGSIEFSSSDLYAGNRALDNIKAKWSQGLKLLKRDVELSAEYDRGAKSDFLKCASLSGSCDKIKYELTTSFDDSPTDVTLETTTGDGTTFEVEGNVDGLKAQVTKVTATRAMKLRDTDCDVEISHDPQAAASKVKLSTVLGSGVTAIGQLASSGGSSDLTYELEYETTLDAGRTLSANVNPKAGTGEIEYVDSATVDGTLTATIPLGGTPKVTLKRAFSF